MEGDVIVMKKHIVSRKILKGAGSVIDIKPKSRYLPELFESSGTAYALKFFKQSSRRQESENSPYVYFEVLGKYFETAQREAEEDYPLAKRDIGTILATDANGI